MRRLIMAVLAMALVVGFWGTALADECIGVLDAAGDCITSEGYAEMFSPESLLRAGAITGYVDNGDGTVTVEYAAGGTSTIAADPLERVVSSSGVDGPTVGEVLFPVEVWLERAYHNFGPY